MNYIPLYVKTSYSLLSSLCDIKLLIEKCKELNIKSIAITDPNMYGVMEFYKECNKNNIKPIIGLELFIDNKLVLLYAKNYEGYQNLTRLTFIKQNRVITIEDLKTYSNNLICVVKDIDLYNDLKNIYDSIYLGYSNIEEKKEVLDITNNIVFVNEILCLNKEDLIYLKYLYLIRDNKKIDSLNEYEVYENCYLDYNIESDYTNELKISDECDASFEFNKNLLPKYDCDNSKEYLLELSKKGLYKRFDGKVTKNYYDRLLYELEVIDNMGYNDYFLVVWDFVKYARKNNILIGSGRGSAAGSLVSYSLGITEVDPIKYNLLFERFLNPERITLPDIDIDFESNHRGDVVDYVIKKYGEKRVVPIITFTTLGGRQVIRDIGRIFDIDTNKIDYISKSIGFNTTLNDALKNDKLNKYLKDNKLVDLYKISMKLDGLKRQISTHAAGIIISNLELDSYIPLQKYDDYYISGFSMEHLEELGLLKIDFLGLKNLTLLDNVLKGLDIKFNDIPLDDKKTLDIFTNVMTEGIFQFESLGMKEFLKKLKPTSFDDIVSAIALFRPGPAQNIDSFVKRKHGKEKIEYIHKDLYNILSSTYGIIIYQEQIMQIANIMAGYLYGEADILRRAMSKKKKEVLVNEQEKFINRCIEKGYEESIAKEIYELILKFANFGFNKSHSVAYSMIAFKMAYLKAHYPESFMSALLTNSIGDDRKTKEYIDECKKMNINILKPDINSSEYKYKKENGGIRFSLATIRNVGTVSCKDIVKEREKGLFTDFFNFVARTYGKSVNRKTLESLIDADCFSEFNFNHNTLYYNIDQAINYAELASTIDESLIDKPVMVIQEEFDKKILSEKEINVFGFYLSNHPVTRYKKMHENIIDSTELSLYFDQYVNLIFVIDSMKEITTKNNKKMLFMTASDEYSSIEIVVFSTLYDNLNDIKTKDTIKVSGKVERRMAKFQLVANEIIKLKE